MTKDARRVESSREGETMAPIEQAAREFAIEITRNQRVRSVYDPVILHKRQRVNRPERKSCAAGFLTPAIAHFKGQSVIKTVADGNQLLNFGARPVRAERIKCAECRIHLGRGSERIEIDHGHRYA